MVPGSFLNTFRRTVDDDGGCCASPFGHDVLGHAGVVGGVGQTGLFDDQVVVDGDVEVSVIRGVDNLLVFQPLHLQTHTGFRHTSAWRNRR